MTLKRRSPRRRTGSALPKSTIRPASPSAAEGNGLSTPTVPSLSEKQRRHLRGLAHDLKPVVRLGGAGLTDAVALETRRALHDHELIKVKAPGGGDREARDALFEQLAIRTESTMIHRIGNVAVLYRPRADVPRILIPDNV